MLNNVFFIDVGGAIIHGLCVDGDGGTHRIGEVVVQNRIHRQSISSRRHIGQYMVSGIGHDRWQADRSQGHINIHRNDIA